MNLVYEELRGRKTCVIVSRPGEPKYEKMVQKRPKMDPMLLTLNNDMATSSHPIQKQPKFDLGCLATKPFVRESLKLQGFYS